MYYQPTETSAGGTAGYQVQLASAHRKLALFGATEFSSTQAAANAPEGNPVHQVTSGKITGHVALEGNLTGTVYQSPGGPGSAAWTAVSWREGRWNIVVENAGTGTPVTESHQVVADLQHELLPAPDTNGWFVVNLTPTTTGAETVQDVDVSWQEGRTVNTVDTFSAVAHPLMTAIRMAISMRAY